MDNKGLFNGDLHRRILLFVYNTVSRELSLRFLSDQPTKTEILNSPQTIVQQLVFKSVEF